MLREKITSDTTGDRSRDLPTSSAGPYVASHITKTSYTCKQTDVKFSDGSRGANEIGQQTSSARHSVISDIHPVQGIF